MKRAGVFFVCLLLIFSFSCKKKNTTSERGVLRMMIFSEPESFDPAFQDSSDAYLLSMSLFEGLFRIDPRALEPVPAAVEKYKISDDGTVYTFYLRKDLKWSNGEPLTARDFEYSLKRVLMPSTASPFAYMLFPIKGARRFFEGKGKDVGIESVDDFTLKITLKKPSSLFLFTLSDPRFAPVFRKAVETFGRAWTAPEHIVSNGPFLLKSIEGGIISLVPNPMCRKYRDIQLRRVEIHVIESSDSALTSYLSGGLDWIVSLPTDRLSELSKRKDYHQSPYLAVYGYFFNVKKPFLSDQKVRRALNAAVDKERIVRAVVRGGKVPARGWVPPFFPSYRGVEGDKYDPALSRRLLREAGYGKSGKQLPPVSIHFNTHRDNRRIAEVVQAMFRENLGLKAVLDHQEWKIFLQRQREGKFDLSRISWIADIPDPYDFLKIFSSKDPDNVTGWSSSVYDDLLIKSLFEEGADRMKMLRDAEEILTKEIPVLPLFYQTRTALVSPRVGGYYDNPMDIHPLEELWVED